MSGVNKVILVATLGRDPELKYTAAGHAVALLSLATSEKWTDKQGDKQERTEWHRVKAWGKLAEVCGEHLQKGRQVYVEGKLQTSKYQDKSGADKYSTEIVASVVQFIGGKKDSGQSQANQGYPPNLEPGTATYAKPQAHGENRYEADDVPF